MSTKSAVTTDQSADRKDKPKPSMLENVQYVTVPAHGVDGPTIRSVKQIALTKPRTRTEGGAAGATKPGTISDD